MGTTIPTLTVELTNPPPISGRQNNPDGFETERDDYVDWQTNDMTPEIQSLITEIKATVGGMNIAVTEAEAEADEAAAARDVAVSSTNAYPWSSGADLREFALGETLIYTDGHSYRCIVATSAGQSPETHPAKWQQITTGPFKILRSTRSSNTTLDIDDKGYVIEFTASFEQRLDYAANLGEGWYCIVENTHTSGTWLTPYGGELIDGLTAFVINAGEVRLVMCTGTAFKTIILKGFCATFDSTATFYKAPGYTRFKGFRWSGGSSGQRTGNTSEAKGGGGGACAPFDLPASAFAASETITIGAGGDAVTTTGQNEGGSTSIGSLCTIYPSPSAQPFMGGSVVEDLTVATPEGYAGAQGSNPGVWGGGASPASAANSGSVYGGAAGGRGKASPENGATSEFGGDGGDGGDSTSGQDGEQPGGGGGGTRTGAQSGAGGDGRVIIMGVV